jgi:TonB family protein
MSTGLMFDNVVAYSLQIGMLVGVAAVIPSVLRLRQPGAKLVYWQILLAACLLLPLQPWKQIVAAGTVQVTTMITAVQPLQHGSSGFRIPRREIALLVLLAGVAVRLGWLAVGFWKLRAYRRHSRPLEPAPSWGVEASLLVSDDIASPVTFGWRKPVVLLPAKFPVLDARVQDAILCHEIMHVRRGDWLFTVAEEMVRAVFWFHPAIWWLLGEIGLAREQEVDRLAIDITREREHYMDALLAIAGARAQLDLAPAPLFLRKRHLRQRVVLIVQEARMSKTRLISTLTTGLAVLAAACWLVTGAFPLTAEPQVVADAAGVTVDLNGATVLHRTPVHYPVVALQRGVEGTVSLEVKLDARGNVSDARVLGGPDELRSAVLQSVLEWHFTRDAANSTRVVEVAFESPKKDGTEGPVVAYRDGAPVRQSVTGGVTGGVPGGVTGGVMGGIAGGVPGQPSRLTGITVAGLSDQARDELLAALPVHEGDEVTVGEMVKAVQAVRAFDEHLNVRLMPGTNGTSTLQIIAPGAAPSAVAALRESLTVTDNAPPPPPPPPGSAMAGSPPERIKVGGNVQSMMIVSKVPPVYPELAKSARVSGVVRLAAVIAKDGTMQELHSLGGPALLIQAAMDAVRQWVYRPTFLNGQPVTVETTIDVNFTLNQ